MFLMLPISNSFAAINGQFKGTIDGNVIDIPVSCDYSRQDDYLGYISVISESRLYSLVDNNKDGIAIDLNFDKKYVIAEIAVKGELYNFNGKYEVNGSRFAYKNKGLLKNRIKYDYTDRRKYDYEVDFIVTCNK